MSTRLALTTGLFIGMSAGLALAQTAPSNTSRNPVQGDPGLHSTSSASTRAAEEAKADKQPPGTENGNQPDRAAAGGGAR